MYVLSTSTSLLPVLTELRSLPPLAQAMFAVCDHVCDVCAIHLYISAPRVLTELRSLPLRTQAMFAVCDHVCDVCAVHLYISAPRVLTELRSLPPRAQAMFAVCDHVCDVCAVHLYISAPSSNGATQSSTAHPGYVCCMWSCMWCMCCPPLHLCS